MPERPFICTRADTLYDKPLNSVSERAELLLVRIHKCSDRYGRFSADPAVVLGECYMLRSKAASNRADAVDVGDIAKAMQELAAAGCIKFCERGGKRWLQIADHLLYEQDSVSKPRWGDEPEVATQAELPMLTETNLPGQKPSSAETRNKMRVEKTDSKLNSNNDSDAPQAAQSAENVNNSETRAGSAGNDSEGKPKIHFVLPPDEEPKRSKKAKRSEEELILVRIGSLAGDKERIENGGMWRLRFREHPVAVKEALGELQLRLLNPKDGPVKSLGAWLTDKFEEFAGKKRKRA